MLDADLMTLHNSLDRYVAHLGVRHMAGSQEHKRVEKIERAQAVMEDIENLMQYANV